MNKSIPLGDVKSFDVNRSIQRSLTKACARHGLGLYIYAGEDLPDSAERQQQVQQPAPQQSAPPRQAPQSYQQSSWRQSRNQYYQQQ